MTEWESDFRDFFQTIKDPLGCVLQANGCREGWLQGEMFRHFERLGKAMYTNYLTLPGPSGLKNRKADLAIYSGHDNEAALLLVGELKVYGESGYYEKNLTGGNLAEVQRRWPSEGAPIMFSNCAEDRQLIVGSGLLADYFRLVDFEHTEHPTRLLILCVQTSDVPDKFGNILRRVEFEQPGISLCETPHFWAKCWVVGERHRV